MVDDDGGLRERLFDRGRFRDSNLIWGFFFTCVLDWLVSASRDIHVTGFGARKPCVKVGQVMCKKISLFYFFVSHFSFPL